MKQPRTRRAMRFVPLLVVLASVLAACVDAPAALRVEVVPDEATIRAGEAQSFDALVTGAGVSDTRVSWSLRYAAEDDVISETGVLLAGDVAPHEGARTIEVVATSRQDPEHAGVAQVTILPPVSPEPGELEVAVEPDAVTLEAGDVRTFDAVVSGDAVEDAAVTWSLRGEAPDDVITSDGVFTAGEVSEAEGARSVAVVATSVQDPEREGVALVTILRPSPQDPLLDAEVRVVGDASDVAPAVVRFDASDSASTAGPIVAYRWTVDGVERPEDEPILDVYFAHPGDHVVALTIEDEAGNVARTEAAVALTASASPFTIDVRFYDDEAMTLAQRQAFSAAARRWAEVVVTDLVPVRYTKAPGECGVPPSFDGVVDDVLVFASIADIDGPGRILAQAGPCVVDGDLFPVYGVMEFDVADLDVLEGNADLEGVILHEMGHVLGIGTLWEIDDRAVLDPLPCIGAPDPRFVGPNAVREWRSYGGSGAVPVHAGDERDGTACGHWREATAAESLSDELMTGFLDAAMDLSRITIGSLEDLGYAVDYGAADPFTLSASAAARSEVDDRIPLAERLILPDPAPIRR